jgi:hypothetical protein
MIQYEYFTYYYTVRNGVFVYAKSFEKTHIPNCF